MQLTDITTVKKIMQENGLSFHKKFGQNFLVSSAVPGRIADAGAGKNTLEIGPGIGTLTRELSARSERVVAVEIDRELIPVLSQTLSDCPNVTVINNDIMQTDIDALAEEYFGGGEFCVCANLPYYITTPIIMKLLEDAHGVAGITVMVQKEVADRICAPAGSPDYGAISAAVAYYGRAERIMRVSPGSFIPAPKVESAVIKITPHKEMPVSCDRDMLFRVVRAAFAQRRKTLVNCLSAEFSMPKDAVSDVVSSCGFDTRVRGEKLGITDFAVLVQALMKNMAKI